MDWIFKQVPEREKGEKGRLVQFYPCSFRAAHSPWVKGIRGVLSAEARKVGEAHKDGQVSTPVSW